MATVAQAPGKLVLVGEYAVLEGSPAISAAVNVCATATLEPVAAATSELRIANCGGRFGFNVAPGGELQWHADPGERGALLDAALEALAARGLLQESLPPVSLELCSRSFYSDENAGVTRKIGIGSSAATIVALTSALQICLGHKPEFAMCLDAHRRFQHGKGSGIDVATSWFGGVIGMQTNANDVPSIEQLSWPHGLNVVPVWTGESASTTAMLQRLALYKERSGAACDSIMQRLVGVSTDTWKHWQAANVDDVIATLDEYGQLLRELDAAAEIGIWSECHTRLNSIARQVGVGYKPSGAGGGDFGLAFSRDASRLEDFVTRVDAELVAQPARLEWADSGLVINGNAVAAAGTG
jgi:phosphomevalonate kinase